MTENLHLILGAVIVVGAGLYGLGDLLRFSAVRAWAVSSVGFTEALRRRVLWITPLAILGIILVTQFQRPTDAQDAIRQSTKVAMFTTGLVTVLASLILACTNLPKEIDSRVIYTIVTKPATRLEIILGKIIAFARVSAAILLILGGFTLLYLHFQDWRLRQGIARSLEAGEVPAISRATLEHYRDAGLLSAKRYARAETFAVLARPPALAAGDDGTRWFFGSGEQDVLVPFVVTPDLLTPPGFDQLGTNDIGAVLLIDVGYERRPLSEEERQAVAAEGFDLSDIADPTAGPLAPGATTDQPLPPPRVSVTLLDANQYQLGSPNLINGGRPIILPETGVRRPVEVPVTAEAVRLMAQSGLFHVQLSGISPGTNYAVRTGAAAMENPPVSLLIPGEQPGTHRQVLPAIGRTDRFGWPLAIELRGRQGTFGQQLRGGPPDRAPLAVYDFRGVDLSPDADGNVTFEFRAGIERSGDSYGETEVLTDLEVTTVNLATGQSHTAELVHPESNRNAYFSIPAEVLAGGDFRVQLRNLSDGHWLGLRPESVSIVRANSPFVVNLAKSLLILWLLSILVVTVAVFCSTFVSWPIAVVLTLVILLGHWGVQQLGELSGTGLGNQVAQDLFSNEAAAARVVSTSVEALATAMDTLARFLPDITRFAALEDLERGIAIPLGRLVESLVVLVGFGLPLGLLAYVFLKNKEVAP